MNTCKLVVLFLLLFSSNLAKSQLVVNEISQGATASKEYIEFVVNGTRTCTDSLADLRLWILDDNNGWLGSGSGQGIATGCLRLANVSNWANVPYGSIILLYDDANKNPSITLPDDPTDANHDLIYIVPVSSPFIEKNTTTPTPPSGAGFTYPTTGFTTGGDWSLIGLANGGDGVLTVSPLNRSVANFSFGYGTLNNAAAATVYKSTAGSGTDYYLTDGNYTSAASWIVGDALTDETPGAPNSALNAQWIAGMQQGGGPLNPQSISDTISGCGSIFLNGTTYTASTVVNDTLKSLGGCDSLYLTHQLFITVPASQNVSLSGCNSVLYNGVTYTSSVIVRDTLKTQSGCDSIYVITTITITPVVTVTNSVDTAACNSLVLNGVTYTSSITLLDTVKTGGGCDSIYNILKIRIVKPIVQNNVLKACASTVFNGVTYTTNALVRDTLKSVLGCDSIWRRTNILIQNMIPVSQADSFSSCRSVVINGVTYTSSVTVKDTLKSSYGCDSVYRTIKIKIQDIAPFIRSAFLFGCDSVVYDSVKYLSSIIIKDTIKSSFGCDSIIINVNIRVSPPPIKDSSTLIGCTSVDFNGVNYTDSIILRDTVRNNLGCDSIYKITNIIVKNIQPEIKSDTLYGCNKYTFNGIEYTDSTVVLDTVRTAEGCDSIYRTNNIFIIKITPVARDTTITGCANVVFNGTTYTTSIVLTDTLKTVLGCDSVVQTNNIIVLNVTPVTRRDTLSACNSVLFGGITYTASTTLRDTVRTPFGCDSIYHFTLIIIKVNAVTQNTSFTSCSSVFYNGTNYTTSTVIRDTVRNAAGCDSIYKITTINIQNTTSTINNTITGCGSAVFNGTTYTNSVILKDTVRTAQFCDSIYKITTIIVKHVVPVSSANPVKGCNSYVLNGITYTTSATVLDTLRTPEGCDSIYRTNVITIINLLPVTNAATVRGCSSVVFNGVTYTSSTTLRDTTRGTSGCDSIYIVTNIEVITPVASANTVSGCNGSVVFNGITYTTSAVIKDTVKSVFGCDSLYRTNNIIVQNITAAIRNISLSGCTNVVYNGTTYTTSVLLSDTVRSGAGCDSIITKVNITIKTAQVVNSPSVNGCGSVLYNGVTYTASAIVRDTIRTTQGCDSIYKVTAINVQQITPVTTTRTITGCNGSVVYNGITYTISTTIKDTTKSIYGCDSLYVAVTIKVQNLAPVVTASIVNGCLSAVYNGVTYTSSTVLRDTIRSIGGCDSIIKSVSINVVTPVAVVNNLQGCNSIVFNGVTYTSAAVVKDTVKSVSGCDSLYRTNNISVQIITPVPANNLVAGCNSVVFNGVTYTSSTTIKDTVRTTAGCDSIYRTTAIVVQNVTAVTNAQTLNGCGSLVYNGITYTASTTITDTTKSIGGCDSLYNTTSIKIVTPIAIVNNVQGCNSIVFNGVTYTSAAVVKDTVKSVSGCDSLYRTNNISVQIITPVAANNLVAGCNSVVFNGVTYTSSTTVKDTLKSTAGCDSIYRTNAIVVQNVTPVANTQTLNGCGSLMYNGVTYTASTTITDTTKGIGGCDSLYNTTSIIIVTPVAVVNNLQGCNSIVFNGTTYTSAAVVKDTVKSVSGCDSLYRTTNISVQIITAVPANNLVAGCNSVVFNGVTYTSSTTVKDTVKTTAGCDSLYRTNTILVQNVTPVANTQTLNGCGSLVYNGVTYVVSTTIKDTTKSIGGCDSLFNTSSINIVTPTAVTQTIRGCNDLLFNGVIYRASTVVNDTVKSVSGCDSLYRVNNLLIQNITATNATNQVKGCGSVVFNGVTYTSSTVVLDTLRTNLFGCDSVYRTNIITIQNITPVTVNNAVSGCNAVVYNGTTYSASTIVRDTVFSSAGCDSIYNVTSVTVNRFAINLTASQNPADIGTTVTLTTSASVSYTVLAWSPSYLFAAQTAINQTMKADTTRQVSVAGVSGAGCVDTASLVIAVRYQDQVFIPNSFTPNNDGRNDDFRIYGNNISQTDLKVFNQWGQLVFEGSDPSKGWNGSFKGQVQPVGVYVYVAKIVLTNGSVIMRKGSINLVR